MRSDLEQTLDRIRVILSDELMNPAVGLIRELLSHVVLPDQLQQFTDIQKRDKLIARAREFLERNDVQP